MLIASFPAGPWQTNCYVVAPRPGGECVIIDPGVGATEGVVAICDEQGLTPVGVVATHGHIDHVYAASRLCGRYDVPIWIHEADRHLLTDPLAGVRPMAKDLLLQLHGSTSLDEPADVRELVDAGALSLAGLDFDLVLAPGHTQGSVLLTTPYVAAEGIDRLVFTGDVLFAGSIGRTDLPGGDHDQMLETLRTRVLPIPDTAALLPGHGGQTTMARERATNPYLQKESL
ncbi:MBL fold metallo-hydrolase [Mariniluteicoccus flavus]